MRIGILGPNGMLGGMVAKHLGKYYDVDLVGRDRLVLSENTMSIPIELHKLPEYDYIINCIGAIKPAFKDPHALPVNTVINSIFPIFLADFCHAKKIRLIHITTDCVYDGATGQYTEKSLHNATDEYGKTKSLGEPPNAMVIRTSIIGPEWNGNKKSLVEWLLSQNNKSINGFTNHIWNGLTTLELSKCIKKIIDRNYFDYGTFHLFSNDVTKHQMVEEMVRAWKLNIEVKPVQDRNYCNRTLRTEKPLNLAVGPASFKQMIEELAPYINV